MRSPISEAIQIHRQLIELTYTYPRTNFTRALRRALWANVALLRKQGERRCA